MTEHNGPTPVNIPQLAERIDQSIEDFKTFVEQRFLDQDAMRKNDRESDRRLLDERFGTQTTSIATALTAQQLALTAALTKADDEKRLTDQAIKAIDDRQREGGGRALGRSDVVGWVVAGAAIVFALIQYLHK